MAKGQHEKILQRLYLQTPAAAAAVKKKWHFGTCQGLKVEHFKGSASDADRKISSSQGKRETRKKWSEWDERWKFLTYEKRDSRQRNGMQYMWGIENLRKKVQNRNLWEELCRGRKTAEYRCNRKA